ncbi:DUF2076 domain-containing protein [Paracoccus shanxieyensis]|uniref:DUF2076 family protein n=1 Tax=Paracoccus shanxieyensis TaxID=2675752 RepID=A0A6L6IVM3_9RHOB|nr:DUF2076 domain-containing protein [Paracoccus shanxieyensis]MTH64273.1 DUF2076 family protein [Paracoccus shanxieyensis]MTH87417.1 DUF2076 family protein [Paracoccus shanxieyensis]
MDHNDRQAIQDLFGKLAQVERQTPARDGEAEAFIRDTVARQPSAPYYMAQTVIMQEHALNMAQQRIQALEAEAAQAQQPQGGFLSRLMGGGGASSVPRVQRPQPGAAAPMQQAQGGGFLAGAAQTAMGVAGGVLLGNAIGSMFAGEASAEEFMPQEDPAEHEGDFGGDDFGGDDF